MRSTRSTRRGFVLALAAACTGTPAMAVVVDFEEFADPPHTLGPQSYYNGSDGAGGFDSRGAHFPNQFSDYGGGFYAWTGWAVSNSTNTTTPGFDNQYSAYAGGGAGGSAFYGVAYPSPAEAATITLPPGARVQSLRVTNATYPALSMRDGDAFAKKFGGPTGTDSDWFKLTITGLDPGGAVVGQVEFYLADYRFADPAQDYILDTWERVDLTSLSSARRLAFALDSSDRHPHYGMNTPAYFAMDDLTFAPEPGSAVLLLTGGALLSRRARRADP